MRTRDQLYAADVYKKVLEIKKLDKVEQNRYGGMAHQLPILIRTAGLAQALAFLESRDTKGHKQLLSDLAATVRQPKLVELSREVGITGYMFLTRQVMAALLWYKRFAQSILDVKPADAGRDPDQVIQTQPPPVLDVQSSDEKGEKNE